MAPKPEPIMKAPGFAEQVFDLLGITTLPDPNKSVSLALKALITEVDDFLMLVLSCPFDLARDGNRAAMMDAAIEWVYTVANNIQVGHGGYYDMLERAKAKAGSANDGTDSDETNSEAPQSMTADNGMDNALQSNEASAAHGTNSEDYTEVPANHIADNASSTSKLTDGDNHRTKRRKIILRVGSRNSQVEA
ncbi:hypothetical protein NW766_011637 [Fusarium irregulare]|uniref:Uncharacterized protein n=1 Tax=Fusarium irregulare TaxID=2494466 RepID=A0A9W8PFL6_9HYPO|nr:hypothetical protein NW766_011637 [Fusarium irregulare]